jgi:hypothetical protein
MRSSTRISLVAFSSPYAMLFSWSATGSLRIRLPVAAKTALSAQASRTRLADPAWRLQAVHDHDVDSRHLVGAQHPAVAEVGLFDAGLFDS